MWIYYTMKYAIRWYCSIVQLHVFQWVYHCFAGGSTCLVCWLCSLPGKSEDPPLPSGNGGGRTEVNKWFVFLPLWCFFLYGFGVKLKNTYYTGAKEINRVASTNFQNEQFSLQSVLYQIEQAWKILKQFPKLFRPWRHHGPTNWWSSRSNICIKRADMDTFSSFTRTHLFIYIYIFKFVYIDKKIWIGWIMINPLVRRISPPSLQKHPTENSTNQRLNRWKAHLTTNNWGARLLSYCQNTR